MVKFYIKNFGCSRRGLDAARIRKYFLANGLSPVGQAEDAELLVAIPCDVVQPLAPSFLAFVNKFSKTPVRMLIYGCLPQAEELKAQTGFNGEILLTKDILQIDAFFPDFRVKFAAIADANEEIPGEAQAVFQPDEIIQADAPLALVEGRPGGIGFDPQYFSVRISEGCLGECTYCSIKSVIGPLKSKSLAVIEQEISSALTRQRFKLNILSSDSGSYGLDIGTTLPELLEFILGMDERVCLEFIQDLHPRWLLRYGKQLLTLFKTGRVLSLLTPIQSGSQRILDAMKRETDAAAFLELLKEIKTSCPGLRVRSQMIIGFPGETEADFRQTLRFAQDMPADEIDIFGYYEASQVASAEVFPKVPSKIIRRRAQRLRQALKIPCRMNLPLEQLRPVTNSLKTVISRLTGTFGST